MRFCDVCEIFDDFGILLYFDEVIKVLERFLNFENRFLRALELIRCGIYHVGCRQASFTVKSLSFQP